MTSSDTSLVVHAAPLRDYIVALYKAFGAAPSDAGEIADHLIEASMEGHDSHGILRAPEYLERIEQGAIDPLAHPQIAAEGPAWATVDGCWGFGQPTSRFAMGLAISKARNTGIACVTVRNGNHMGRVGHYTLLAAREGMVGLGCVNLNGSSGVVAPFGGIDRRLATNPFSVAFPIDREPSFMADFATSVVAEGKVQLRRNSGDPIPHGWLIDHQGQPTSDPWELYSEPLAALLPLGGLATHKGYALGLMVESLAGALSGGECVNPEGGRHGNACWYVAINIEAFTPLEQFKVKVGRMIDYVKTSRPLPGIDVILYPGEAEYRCRAHRLANGIPIDPVTLNRLAAKARAVSIDPLGFSK
jgi:LDH2 family malate/lactate/ureidoglycolate dehydrogenase